MNTPLYLWQEECLSAWFNNRCQGIVQAVTGSGKTLLALEAARRLEDKLAKSGKKLKVKIVVPTSALMRQWERAVKEFRIAAALPVQKIGLRGGGFKDRTDCPYMIYVINSARYELARQILSELQKGETILLIADECHHYQSGQNRLIFEFLPRSKPYARHFFSLGLSATLPAGEEGHYLCSVLGRKIYSYGMEKALTLQTVCPYDIFHIALPFTWKERMDYNDLTDKMNRIYSNLLNLCPKLRHITQTERFALLRELSAGKNLRIADMAASYMALTYQRKSLICLASSRLSCVCALISRLEPGEKIIIFGERIAQADELYGILHRKYPQRVGRIHSQMGAQANKNTLERFRAGDLRILVSCKAMDEGVDVPDASVGIILSSTSAQRQRIQRLGRIIRKSEGKERASLYYLHIEESAEDNVFLPDSKDIRLFDLKYHPDTGEFSCKEYQERAERLLERLQSEKHRGEKRREEQRGKEKQGEEQQKEARRCLQKGIVRADWKREIDDLEIRINSARYASEKNYWICMKRMREMDSPAF